MLRYGKIDTEGDRGTKNCTAEEKPDLDFLRGDIARNEGSHYRKNPLLEDTGSIY